MSTRTLRCAVFALLASLAFVETASAYYDPRTGRFINRDPIGEPGAALARSIGGRDPGTSFIQRDGSEPGGSNRCAYVFNAPGDRIDPVGLMGCTRTPPLPSPGQICGPIPNPNPTDAECCSAAQANCANGNAGGVICCDGRKVSCSWHPNAGAPGDDILTSCIIEHEDDHHNDVSCGGCPAGQICRPNFDPGANPKNEECSAYWVEIDCLLRHGQTTCHSRGSVQDQIDCVRKVEAQIKDACKAMKDNPNCKSFPGICSAYGL